MPVKFIENNQELLDLGTPEVTLREELSSWPQIITLEKIQGQYWLHSDQDKENPIGIEIDKILTRHEEFFRKSSLQKELLARAIGVKGPHRPQVLDLTAGLLGDTLLFLAFGCQVTAVERHPLVGFLIQNAIENAQHPLVKNLKFLPLGASEVLSRPLESEVIYFDPMFEDVNSKASPRKEMRIFRSMVGEDQDAKTVFEEAFRKGPKRLVVKRPRHSRPLAEKEAVVFSGKATRYDVYFPFGANPLK